MRIITSKFMVAIVPPTDARSPWRCGERAGRVIRLLR